MVDEVREIDNRNKFTAALKPYVLEENLKKIGWAYVHSKYGHRGQVRDNGTRYFDHPRVVATIVFQELRLYDWQMIAVALLHDIIEDSYLLSEEQISLLFGQEVALWVKLLTKEPGVDYHSRLMECDIWQVLTIKLCDRLSNIRDLKNCTLEKQVRYLKETKEVYLPLADRLVT